MDIFSIGIGFGRIVSERTRVVLLAFAKYRWVDFSNSCEERYEIYVFLVRKWSFNEHNALNPHVQTDDTPQNLFNISSPLLHS